MTHLSSSPVGLAHNADIPGQVRSVVADLDTYMIRNLARDMSGDDVRVLQKALAVLGYFNVTPNGHFGPKTEDALIRFKIAAGLSRSDDRENARLAGPRTKTKVKELLLQSLQAPKIPADSTLLQTASKIADAVRHVRPSSSDDESITRTPKQTEILHELMAQYDSSVATWRRFKIDTKNISTKEEVTVWLKSLPGKTLENLAAYGPVRLKFIPPANTAQLADSMKRSKIIPLHPRRESVNYRKGDDTWNVESDTWEFGITVDVEDMPPRPEYHYVDPSRPYETDLIRNRETFGLYKSEFNDQGLDVMPQEAYLPSVMDARVHGKVFDRDGSSTHFESLLGEEGDSLPAATCEDAIILGGADAGSSSSGHCRPWVGRKKFSRSSRSPREVLDTEDDALPLKSGARAFLSSVIASLLRFGRSDVLKVSDHHENKKSPVRTPEQMEFLSRLIAQYDSSVETWKRCGVDVKNIQIREEVVAWLEKIPTESLDNLKTYGPVRLKFIPPGKPSDHLQILNANKTFPGQTDSKIHHQNTGWKKVLGSNMWRFGLTVDTECMPFDRDVSQGLGWDFHANQKAFARYVEKFCTMGLKVMPPEAYVPSQIDCIIARGQILDARGADGGTMFKDNLCAGFEIDPKHYNILLDHFPDISYGYCRPWLEGGEV